jgi:hypothetical protein
MASAQARNGVAEGLGIISKVPPAVNNSGSRLRCESVVPTTQASVEAPLRSEPTGRAEKLRRE